MSRSVSMPAPSPSRRHPLVSLVAGLALVLLLGGLVVPHGAAEEHSDLPIGTHLDANARHPDQPLHMETADPEVVHGCTACLLQTSTRSSLSCPASVPLPDDSPGPIVIETDRIDGSPVPRLAPARAPPLVLPCR